MPLLMMTNLKGKSKMLVECYGEVWNLSKRNYAKLLKLCKEGNDWDLDKLGKNMGRLTTMKELESARDERLAPKHP